MNWFVEDWRELMPTIWANVILTLVAILCGSIVGLERERKEKPAGIIMLSLVCLGAAVFTMVSVLLVDEGGDRSRIAAQVVTGIGFLGAGVILRGSGNITGTITAATVWVIAAIGMTVGAGYAGAAIGLSILVLMILMVISKIEQSLIDACGFRTVIIVFDPNRGKTLVRIEEMLDAHDAHTEPKDFRETTEGLMEARLTYCHTHRNHREVLGHLAELPEVKEIRREN